MSASEKCYVKVDRDDGSRTYKGPWVHSHCKREADAWRLSFRDYRVQIIAASDARADVKLWARATRDGGRYYPEPVPAQ